MKKAKLLFAATAVIAVAGGALAFKAKSFVQPITIYKWTTSYVTSGNTLTGCLVSSVIQNAHFTAPDQGIQFNGLDFPEVTDDDVCTTKVVFEGAE